MADNTDNNTNIHKDIHTNKVMDTIWNIGSAINSAYKNINYNNSDIINFDYKNKVGLDKFTSNQIIQVGDYLQDIFNHFDLDSEEMKKRKKLLNPPRICVIGSQSSGKSITLNGIMGIDILPNGKSIVTRTPIHLRLINELSRKNILIEFYEKSSIISQFEIDIDHKSTDLFSIREQILFLTEKYAGKSKNVIDRPIEIKIKSPNVPNLSIIDLPGLTNIALTDKGQPKQIKQNIEEMLIKYINNPRTIILSIIPATIDVESDMGLGLIKKYDSNFERTIGVITKIDLLKDSDIIRYLKNSISKDLSLAYGYYAIRNRSSNEIENDVTTIGGYDIENDFFKNTQPYNLSDNENIKGRMGVINLGTRLSEILINHLRDCLPDVISEIKKLDNKLENSLDEIGRDYPNTYSQKRNTLNILLNDFQNIYSSSIKDRGAIYNTGALISKEFNFFKKNMNTLTPFSKDHYSDELIKNIIDDYEGLHMPSFMISTGVIEKCFQGKVNNNYEPLQLMNIPFLELINKIKVVLVDLVDSILDREKYSRFPNLVNNIRNIIFSEIIPHRHTMTLNKVNELFIMEKECIWTDDKEFRNNILPKMGSENYEFDSPELIRKVLTEYFNVIKTNMKHNIHKTVQTFFVNRVINDININLNDMILDKLDIKKLLEENKDKAVKREKLLYLKEKINSTLELIAKMN
jgi:dynamin 1-like protein